MFCSRAIRYNHLRPEMCITSLMQKCMRNSTTRDCKNDGGDFRHSGLKLLKTTGSIVVAMPDYESVAINGLFSFRQYMLPIYFILWFDDLCDFVNHAKFSDACLYFLSTLDMCLYFQATETGLR
jgi:hypothetical protein